MPTSSGDFSFGKSQRLLKPNDYRQVFSQACYKASNAQLLMLSIANTTPTTARLGLVIAKKHVRLAAQRNRLKRQIRESFRHHQVELAGLDIVVLARAGCGLLSNEQLRQQLDQLWKRLLSRRQRDLADR